MKQAIPIVMFVSIVIIALVLVSMLSPGHAKIVYVSEISRHGARTPGTLFDFAK